MKGLCSTSSSQTVFLEELQGLARGMGDSEITGGQPLSASPPLLSLTKASLFKHLFYTLRILYSFLFENGFIAFE